MKMKTGNVTTSLIGVLGCLLIIGACYTLIVVGKGSSANSKSHPSESVDFVEPHTLWIDAIKTLKGHIIHHNTSAHALYEKKLDSCWKSEKVQEMFTLECSIPYIYTLYTRPVQQITGMKELNLHKKVKPGIKFEFGNGYKGYWKACNKNQGGTVESFESELISFHVAQNSGIRRTATVVGRAFGIDEMTLDWPSKNNMTAEPSTHSHQLGVSTNFTASINDITRECSLDGKVGGAIKGWLRWPLHHFFIFGSHGQGYDWQDYNKKAQYLRFKYVRKPKDLMLVMERIRAACWMLLSGWYKRSDHNIDVISKLTESPYYGPVVFVDNDRARYTKNPPNDDVKLFQEYFLGLCKFPRSIYQNLKALTNRGFGLGDAVMDSLHYDPSRLRVLSNNEIDILNGRGELLLQSIEHCIELNGEDSVLYDDPADSIDVDPYENYEQAYNLTKFEAVLK